MYTGFRIYTILVCMDSALYINPPIVIIVLYALFLLVHAPKSDLPVCPPSSMASHPDQASIRWAHTVSGIEGALVGARCAVASRT